MFAEIALILTFGVGDTWTTWKGINLGIKEVNPLVAAIWKKSGVKGLIAAKTVLIAAFITYNQNELWVFAGVGAIVTGWNLRQIRMWKEDHQ